MAINLKITGFTYDSTLTSQLNSIDVTVDGDITSDHLTASSLIVKELSGSVFNVVPDYTLGAITGTGTALDPFVTSIIFGVGNYPTNADLLSLQVIYATENSNKIVSDLSATTSSGVVTMKFETPTLVGSYNMDTVSYGSTPFVITTPFATTADIPSILTSTIAVNSASVVVGTVITVTITLKDQYGNLTDITAENIIIQAVKA